METKKDIRKESLIKRDQLSKESQKEFSNKITKDMINHPFFKNANYILLYANFKSEVQTEEIAKKAYMDGKKVFYPKVLGETMDYYLKNDHYDVDFNIGNMGIREPSTSKHEFIHELKFSKESCKNILMIMPGVAFDNNRNRIGYGKGYFDKYLYFLKNKLLDEKDVSFHTIALAYSCQIVNQIPTEKTDVKPEIVITENNIYE